MKLAALLEGMASVSLGNAIAEWVYPWMRYNTLIAYHEHLDRLFLFELNEDKWNVFLFALKKFTRLIYGNSY